MLTLPVGQFLLFLDNPRLLDLQLVRDKLPLACRVAAALYTQFRFIKLQLDGDERHARPCTKWHFTRLAVEG
ncbi:hypothetical protein [Paraburkholderia sediminicola]|uniref:hypothetical protein n=1 Tax=Paraburkholderia sediminicola TaxID=458836 RepID=UPI0038BD874A